MLTVSTLPVRCLWLNHGVATQSLSRWHQLTTHHDSIFGSGDARVAECITHEAALHRGLVHKLLSNRNLLDHLQLPWSACTPRIHPRHFQKRVSKNCGEQPATTHSNVSPFLRTASFRFYCDSCDRRTTERIRLNGWMQNGLLGLTDQSSLLTLKNDG